MLSAVSRTRALHAFIMQSCSELFHGTRRWEVSRIYRALKDYITAAKDGVHPTPLSPFNIKADSVLMGNFLQDEVRKLFAQ